MSEPATEDWIRKRWGGFTYLLVPRNESFMLDFKHCDLWLNYENGWIHSTVDRVILFENATQENVIDVERSFGIEIE